MWKGGIVILWNSNNVEIRWPRNIDTRNTEIRNYVAWNSVRSKFKHVVWVGNTQNQIMNPTTTNKINRCYLSLSHSLYLQLLWGPRLSRAGFTAPNYHFRCSSSNLANWQIRSMKLFRCNIWPTGPQSSWDALQIQFNLVNSCYINRPGTTDLLSIHVDSLLYVTFCNSESGKWQLVLRVHWKLLYRQWPRLHVVHFIGKMYQQSVLKTCLWTYQTYQHVSEVTVTTWLKPQRVTSLSPRDGHNLLTLLKFSSLRAHCTNVNKITNLVIAIFLESILQSLFVCWM